MIHRAFINWFRLAIGISVFTTLLMSCGDDQLTDHFDPTDVELETKEHAVTSQEAAWSFSFPTTGYQGDSYQGRDFLSPSNHLGEDSAHDHLTPVHAVANGVVKQVRRGNSQGYGSVVVIEHRLPSQEVVQSIYGHLCNHTTHRITVDVGEVVTKGQLIGYIGEHTCDSCSDDENGHGGEHLHLGIKQGSYDGLYCGYESQQCPSSDFLDPSSFIQERDGSLNIVRLSASSSDGVSATSLTATIRNEYFYGGLFEFRAYVDDNGTPRRGPVTTTWIDPNQSGSIEVDLPVLNGGSYRASYEFRAPDTTQWWPVSSRFSADHLYVIIAQSASGTQNCHTGSNGDSNYCSASCPCAEGHGDCDSDSECQAGLICAQNVGSRYGVSSVMDFCEQPATGGSSGGNTSCHQGSNGASNYCSTTCPCAEGFGDCDSDAECQPGLVCAQNVGAQYGVRSVMDFCEQPSSGGSSGGSHLPSSCTSLGSFPSSGGSLTASTTGSSSLSSSCGGSNAPEQVYSWTPSTSGQWTISTCGSGFDTIIYLLDRCDQNATEIACNDDGSQCANYGSRVQREFIAGQSYFIVVDGYGSNAGSFTINVQYDGSAGSGSSSGGSSSCHQGTNGGSSYCSASCPCSEGHGDCDSDVECESGLICAQNVGTRYGVHSSMDFCEQPATNTSPDPATTCHQGANGGSRYCSESCPCAEGYGDCDSDAECQPGLICAQDVGARYGVHSAMDFCEPPLRMSAPGGDSSCHQGTNGHSAYCSTSCPCAEGYGDCDSDAECQPGLFCAQNVGARYGVSAAMDFCEAPISGGSTGGTGTVSPCDQLSSIPAAGGTISGITSGMSALSSTCGGSAAPEQIFSWTPSVSGEWSLSTCGSGFDTVIYLTDQCGQNANELACNDDGTQCANYGSRIQENLIAGQSYFVVVDGYGNQSGQFSLNVTYTGGGSSSSGGYSCHNGDNGSPNYCTSSCPCSEGYGDCDSDDECQAGLICRRDVGARYGVNRTMDFCERP